MPSGIIMASSSVGATPEAIEKVLVANGHEPDKPEVQIEAPVEPKREDFPSDEEFQTAQDAFEAAQEEAEDKKAEEDERKRLEASPKKSRRQRAVERATQKLQDDLRQANERLAVLEGKGGTKPEEKKPPEAPKTPKREDFKSDAEYDDALFDYRYQMRRAKEQAETAQRTLNERLETNFTEYKASVVEFKEDHDDWDEVVNTSIAISNPVYFAIVDLGKEGPPVTYYLGQHPEECDRLAELTPYRAAIEVGRLADKLKNRGKTGAAEATKKPAPKKIPEPVRPVSTSATSSTLTSREAAAKGNYKDFKRAQRQGV